MSNIALREWWHGHADGRAGSVFYGGKWVRNEESLNGTRSWIVSRTYRCDVEIVDVRFNPANEIFEEFPESRKLYSGCIVCMGLKFHLVSVGCCWMGHEVFLRPFLICITRRLSGFLFDLESMNLPVTGTMQAEYSTTNYPSQRKMTSGKLAQL